MNNKKTRMSIDILGKDHKKIKMMAAKEGVSIRKFVLTCIQDRFSVNHIIKKNESVHSRKL